MKKSSNIHISNYSKDKIDEEFEDENMMSEIMNTDNKILVTLEQTKYENLQVTDESRPLEKENETEKMMNQYVEKLEKKIRTQATRLTELEKYRYLCEMRIKQINPNQIFPITESHLNNNNNTMSTMNTNEFGNKSTLDWIPYEKYDTLQKNYINLMSEFNDMKNKMNQSIRDVTRFSFDFPEPEKIKNFDHLKDFYTNLLSCFKNQILEKEEILDQLRKETVNSEEQRNYIEVLTRLVNSDLIKSGIISEYIRMDQLIDLNEIKFESDQYLKELTQCQGIIAKLKIENEDLKNNNSTLIKNKEKIKHTLENGLNEMEKCKEEVRIMEFELNNLKEINQILLKERDDSIMKNSLLTNKVKDINKLSENQNEFVMNRLNEYKLNYDKLNNEFELILKDRTKIEIENSKMIEEIKILKEKLEINKIEIPKNRKNSQINEDLLTNELNKNYRQMFEEISLEFEEFKNSHKKISLHFLKNLKKSYKKSQEKSLEERTNLLKENEKFKNEIQNFDFVLKNTQSDLKDYERDYKKYLDLYEEEVKKVNTFTMNNNSFSYEIERLKDDLNFQKEKYDKDISNKNKEILNLNEDLNSLKKELMKLKENFKENKKILNEKEDIMEELKIKLEKFEKMININNDRDNNLLEKSDKLEVLNRKFNKNLLELEEYKKDIEKLNKNLEEIKLDKLDLEQRCNDNIKDLSSLDKNRKEIIKENENLKEINNQKDDEISQLKEKIETHLNKIKSLESDLLQKENSLNLLQNEKYKMENHIEFLSKENEQFKKDILDVIERNKNLQEFVSNLKIQLYSIHSLLKISVHKFNSFANEDLDSLMTKNFSQNLSKLFSQVNKFTTDSEDNLIIQTSMDYIKIFSQEFENIYEKLIDSNNYLKDLNGKIILLENSINEISQTQGISVEKEKKLKNLIKNLNEEKNQNEEKLSELNKEINYLQKEREEIILEMKRFKSEIYSLQNQNNNLSKENQKLLKENEEQLNNFVKLENKCIIYNKEKKYSESLLQNFVKSYPSREVTKLMNDIININDYIFKTEIEKMRIEEKLNIMEKEFKILSEDKNSQNNDLSQIVKNEQENFKSLIKNYEKKINEKRENQKLIENEINNLEGQVRNTYELNLKSENELKRLNKELEDCKENIKKNNYETFDKSNTNKMMKTSGNPLLIKNNQMEISCLESNIFTQSNSGNKNLSLQQLTDYDSLVLEYSEDYPKDKNNLKQFDNKFAEKKNSNNDYYKSKYNNNKNNIISNQNTNSQMLDIKSLQESNRSSRNEKINSLNSLKSLTENKRNMRNINLI